MDVRDRILKGALELFTQAGLKNVTMDDIARHLAISKKTIYQFFKDKGDIINEVVLNRLHDDECDMRAVLDSSDNVFEEMINMIRKSGEIMANINPIIFTEMKRFYPEAWKLFENFKGTVLIGQFEGILEKGKQQGYVRQNVDTPVLARLHVNEIFLAFDQTLFPVKEFDLSRLHFAFFEHFLYGICTIKGHRMLNEYKQITEVE
ncbi:MAG: TetR/AcrR family transcriptional regulator [Mucilaginibacter polytrichastri]|nr:TetR/AcrR family transcriptional regulator [Mucilaginibacter polytrichastri]